jgi:hypothetical protein
MLDFFTHAAPVFVTLPTLVTTDVWKEISKAATNSKIPAHVAVAYFGQQGPKLLPLLKGSSLVVDASIITVAQGATCPAALEQLRQKGVEIYGTQFLHAKVFAFDKVAFVGSANVSQYSASTLIEALLKVDTKQEILAIRDFVSSLSITRLSAAVLEELGTFYNKPKYPRPIPKQGLYSTLLMELTYEQGPSRITQVQPPKDVWTNFFGIPAGSSALPLLTLINEKVTPSTPIKVKSSSIITLIRLRLRTRHYRVLLSCKCADLRRINMVIVHRPSDPTFAKINHLVQTLPNPLWQPGPRPHGSLCVVLMGLRVAEVHEHTVAHVLRHEPTEPLHSLSNPLLIGRNDLAEVLRVRARRERCRTDEVREHHGDLAALGGVFGLWLQWGDSRFGYC